MLTPHARAQLEALATTALPGGQLLPGADARTVEAAERLLAALPAVAQAGFPQLLRALDARALLSYRRRFTELPFGRRVEVLDALDRNEATRLLLRGLLTPLKLAYFDDPAVYAKLGCRYTVDRPARLEHARWREQIADAATLPAGEALECDVVVVGTGAGGAPIAAELARRGHAVLLLEEGAHFTRLDFDGRALGAMKKMYRNSGVTVAFGNTAIPIPIGRGVGGTTLINSGTCFRLPPSVLAAWRDAGLADFTPDALAPHYEEVERLLEVGPSSAAALGKPAQLIAKGCDALGYSHHPLARNAPGCDGQGLCCFGCPTDAKRSTNVSWVPKALDRGAQLLTGFKVEQVLVERGAAVGVKGRSAAGELTVRAKVVVLACGALMTPVLLLQNGLANNSGQVGKNLSIHPASAALAVYDESINPMRTVPQGYAIDEFADEGLYFEGGTTPLELTAASIGGYGPAFMSLMEQFDRTFNFGFMVKDTSRGRVTVGRDGSPRITYWLNDADLQQLHRGFSILSRVYFAGGATEVQLPIMGHTRFRSLRDVEAFEASSIAARHVDLTAYHPLGTAKMGVDPLRSVVDGTHETHDVTSLFICDGSAVPSSLGVNPQLTIMAMSLRAAEFVHRRVERLSRLSAGA
ncbi:MAG: GMC family oxidoreductase N-terminal domain-containing protein [Myxococcota bacterium]